MNLSAYGWNPYVENEFQRFLRDGYEPARVAREERGRYLLLGRAGPVGGQVAGRFRREAKTAAAFPVVGDWVVVRFLEGERQAVIHGLVERRTAFARSVPGARSDLQVLAANVDVAFLVSGLDQDFNPRRIERYLTLTYESGATPVLVLNKADLEPDLELRVRQVEGLAPGVSVLTTSALAGGGVEALREQLGAGRTAVLLGSSGAGKSSLVNRLLGRELQATGVVRACDGRGRHVTTRRQLFELPDEGGLVIDTPGLRELQLAGDTERALESFGDVQEAAATCRFRDCRHQGEPGCGVREALLGGTLDAGRYESFLEHQRELAYQRRRQDLHARKAEKARWRRITMNQRKRRNAGPDRR